MKKCQVHVGLIITADDGIKSDIIMNYVLNSLMLDGATGIIKTVDVRGIEIPSVEDVETSPTNFVPGNETKN